MARLSNEVRVGVVTQLDRSRTRVARSLDANGEVGRSRGIEAAALTGDADLERLVGRGRHSMAHRRPVGLEVSVGSACGPTDLSRPQGGVVVRNRAVVNRNVGSIVGKAIAAGFRSAR